MRSLEQLDSWITSKVRTWSNKIAGNPVIPELLEIRRDILNDVRHQIQWKGEGRSVFPYNTITIHIPVDNPGRQALLAGAFADTNEWEETVRALLTEAGCPVPSRLHVAVSVELKPDLLPVDRPFQIDFANTKPVREQQLSTARPSVTLSIVRGEADLAEYNIDSDRINLGRLKEVISDKDGLRRRNHVAFAETETTVSREHASIRYEEQTGRFRIYDCMSQRGTRVFRDGRRFDVPNGPTRGFQLRSGDEIHLGDARLRFDTDNSSNR